MVYSYSIDKKHSVFETPLQRSESYPTVPVPHQGAVGPQAEAQAGASVTCHGRPRPSLGSYRIIKKNDDSVLEQRLKRLLKMNEQTVNQFKEYLRQTAECKFTNNFLEWDYQNPPSQVTRDIGYIHRWTPVYRRAVIAKMYLLEKWHNEHDLPVTMGTFTSYQDGEYAPFCGKRSIKSCFKILKRGWFNLTNWLRYYYPDLLFVYFFEPHKSGYPHLHAIFFGELSPEIQDKIKVLWSEKYQIGSLEHGVKFDEIKELKSVRNYIIKYMSKILKHSNTDGWSPAELLFNAVMWKQKFRLWGASRPLSKVMRRPEKPQESIDLSDANVDTEYLLSHQLMWTHTTMTDPHGNVCLIRECKNYNEISEFIENKIPPIDYPDCET